MVGRQDYHLSVTHCICFGLRPVLSISLLPFLGMGGSLVSGFFLVASRFARAISRRFTVTRHGLADLSALNTKSRPGKRTLRPFHQIGFIFTYSIFEQAFRLMFI
jgi:hypothetical protein